MTRANKLDKMNLKHLENGKRKKKWKVCEFFFILLLLLFPSVCYCCCHPSRRNSAVAIFATEIHNYILRTNLQQSTADVCLLELRGLRGTTPINNSSCLYIHFLPHALSLAKT